ncbi:MAG: hypothetical protein HYT70_04670 [Candidatus Aenigmarchaeota archaeon]|nr:hypothetical protein [Candidatus Aenigmarchaeota archaeon]
MKLQTIVLFIFAVSVIAPFSYAHMTSSSADVNDIMASMMAEQGVSTVGELSCNNVSGQELEGLGDSVMEKMAGDHELHEQMDAMMGGEGSESLKQMHIIMGKNWLGCGTVSGMMNVNMMPMMMRMMGNYYPGYFADYNTLFLVGALGWVLFIITLVLYLTRQKRKR